VVLFAVLLHTKSSTAAFLNSWSCGGIEIERNHYSRGNPNVELSCESDNRTTLRLSSQLKYYVKSISDNGLYFTDTESNWDIQLIDPGLNEHDYCSIPLNSFTLSGDDYRLPFGIQFIDMTVGD
jgi:hypothetical protein